MMLTMQKEMQSDQRRRIVFRFQVKQKSMQDVLHKRPRG